MKITSFEELDIWKEGISLVENAYKNTSLQQWKYEFALKEQIRKSAISIPSNIAEGFEKNSTPEFKRFLLIAKGSCGELRTQFYIAKKIALLEEKAYEELYEKCRILSANISKLITYLKEK